MKKIMKKVFGYGVFALAGCLVLSACSPIQDGKGVPEKTQDETVLAVQEEAVGQVQETEETAVLGQVTDAAEELQELGKKEEGQLQEIITDKDDNDILWENLHFIDAWGEWHDMAINPNLPHHDYQWEYLVNTEDTIQYNGDERYRVRKGIDVSYHKGTIDWERVKADGIEFAFIRIGYRGYGKAGKLKVDTEFHTNIVNAEKAGIDVGVYIFSQAINEEEALEEAELVITELTKAGVELQLPVVYDPESIRDAVARTDDVTGEQFTQNTIVFCEKIEEAGYEPMIYSNIVWEAYLFDLTKLTDYPIWYADYEKIPQTPYWFSFWQYSCDGKVDGISGRVDMNLQFIKE